MIRLTKSSLIMKGGTFMKIAVVTDSSCDVNKATIEKYNIRVIPLQVVYKDKSYRDGIEINTDLIMQNIDEEIPKTSLPLHSDVCNLMEKLKEENYTHILFILISSGLSGTYNMVKSAVEPYRTDFTIELIDSKMLSRCLGSAVIEAAKMAKITEDFQKSVDRAKEVLSNTIGFFTVDTLKYLKKGGRISRFEGGLASVLDIRPIIGINEDGAYYPAAKVRGRNKSLKTMFDLVEKYVKGKEKVSVVVVQAGALEEAEELVRKFKNMVNVVFTHIELLSPTLSIHVGAGGIGITAWWEK